MRKKIKTHTMIVTKGIYGENGLGCPFHWCLQTNIGDELRCGLEFAECYGKSEDCILQKYDRIIIKLEKIDAGL